MTCAKFQDKAMAIVQTLAHAHVQAHAQARARALALAERAQGARRLKRCFGGLVLLLWDIWEIVVVFGKALTI